MAAKDLITTGRARQNLQSLTDSSQDSLLATLITAVSDAIEKYCRRDFYVRSYDELYNGSGERRLLLREYPVQSVESLLTRPTIVLRIQNTNRALNQRASVAITSTGLRLVRVASGVVTADTSVTWAANPTLQAVANAVNALANGWQASVAGESTGDFGLWASADLYVKPSYGDGTQSSGALDARSQAAGLKLHLTPVRDFEWDARGWLIWPAPCAEPDLLQSGDAVWPPGINNFRVQYTAGYSTIPEAVQEACALWVAGAYFQTLRDPLLASQSVPGAVAQAWQRANGLRPPAAVAALLAPFRRHSVASQQG